MMRSHQGLSFIFLFFLSLTLVSAPALDNPNIPIVKPDPLLKPNITVNISVNHSNSTDYLITTDGGAINSLSDILHNLLGNLEWSLAGHVFDTHVDFNEYDIHNISNVNATQGWFEFINTTTINVSNSTLFIGDQAISSNETTLKIAVLTVGTISGEGSRLFNLTLNESGNFTNVTVVNLSADNVTATNVSADQFFGGWFNGSFNWTAEAPWLEFNGSNLEFNETNLNSTITDIVGNISGDGDWNESGDNLYPWDLNWSTSIGLSSTTGMFEVLTRAYNETNTVPAANVSAFYRFEEGSGGFANDSSGNNHNGTHNTQYVGSKGGNGTGTYALNFSGAETVVVIDNVDVDLNGSLTFMAWVNVSASTTSNRRLIDKWGSGTGYYLRQKTNEELRCNVDNDIADSVNAYDDNQWHHVVCVNDPPGNVSIWVDGVLEASSGGGFQGDIMNNADLYIGSDGGSTKFFVGEMDEVAFFNYALNQTEIENYFQFGVNTTEVNVTEEKGNATFIVDKDGKVGVKTTTPTQDLTVIGDGNFTGDLIVEGSLIGGSPVKIFGGLNVKTGGLEVNSRGSINLTEGKILGAADIQTHNVTADDTIVAPEIVDLTPAYPGTKEEAITDLKRISSNEITPGRKEVNHSSYPEFVRKEVETSGGKLTEGRSVGALVSLIQDAVQGLIIRYEVMQAVITNQQNTIDAQADRINTLESELCKQNPSYSFCGIGIARLG